MHVQACVAHVFVFALVSPVPNTHWTQEKSEAYNNRMITLENVTKTYSTPGGDFHAVKEVSFTVSEGEFAVLIGPSGSGKTTTMRMINRLEKKTSGTILVNGKDIESGNDVELRRKIGYVIQQGGLLPHMTVADNVSIVPRLLGWDKKRQRQRAEELLALVDLDPDMYADRFPRQLSGGQQQRVGVARALAADAPIILMDEPFGAVDPITRAQLQRWLRKVQQDVKKTVVFVTHDINEAFMLGDRIILMKEGEVVQNGSPADLLRRPANDFVREFIGDEFALQALEHTHIAELAKPDPPALTDDSLVLPGDLSVPEASREISSADTSGQEGFWVSNGEGDASGYVTYEAFASALSEGVAAEALDSDDDEAPIEFEDEKEGTDAVPS